ncbi:hypothetical protein E4U52_006735 [Claviceps spartinae]|nr:hypothetical protein E4U52_006735 [Claviceps spartinae]
MHIPIPRDHIHGKALIDFCDTGILWDPVLSAYFFQFDPQTSHLTRLVHRSPRDDAAPIANLTSFLYFTGLWGDAEYPKHHPLQKTIPFFGLDRSGWDKRQAILVLTYTSSATTSGWDKRLGQASGTSVKLPLWYKTWAMRRKPFKVHITPVPAASISTMTDGVSADRLIAGVTESRRSTSVRTSLNPASTGAADSSVSQTLLKQAVMVVDIGLPDPGLEDFKVQEVISEVMSAVVI